ncbi:acyl-CoA dehydrogenase family protein [Thalassobacillus sp. CUG 92003]|uniref:acyl-CoA dehydrogenase family protein n=1 Tax=Thalassobacillus sp. CUG 92003 TaxID=2736641 RepID=UPI0015E71B64|nr:acyl-CoA dehydrogenase family protein [Thalassobacillus sp. CUG 92003]
MNFYEEDPNLQGLLKAYLDDDFYRWADEQLEEFGEMCAHSIDERAVHTDREGQPRLIKYNKFGEDISEVWLNEGYKRTVKETYDKGIVGYVHKPIPELGRKGNYIYSFAQGYLLSHAEPGFYCPVTLTMATAYLIDHYASDELKSAYLPHVLATGDVELNEGATFLTERQGGSDVGVNEVQAIPDSDGYRIYGEKYFASNAGACGVAMVLARMEGATSGSKGLSLFLVPWRQDDGSLNGIKIRRLKDKLGVRAVPSAEVEFEGAKAYLVGEAEQGFYYMMEALNLSRVCNAVASIGIMRRAYLEAREYACERTAFDHRLIEYPMVQDTLTTLAAKQEVETSAIFNMISRFDRIAEAPREASQEEQILNRLLIAIMKKESAEQAIHFSHDALELHGGNGFIEDFVTPRLLRDAQVLTVWEGTANILGLEVLRLVKRYDAHHLFQREVRDKLRQGAFDKGAQLVEDELVKLEVFVEEVLQQTEDRQTYHSKHIAKRMADIFEGVTALTDANKGDARKQKIAEVFLEKTFQEESGSGYPLTMQYSEDILNVEVNAKV